MTKLLVGHMGKIIISFKWLEDMREMGCERVKDALIVNHLKSEYLLVRER